jgi:hypothetical protein
MTRGLHKDRRAHLGIKPTQKLIHTEDVRKGPHVSQLEAGVDQPGPQGFGRTDLWSVDPGLPCGCPSLVQGSIPGVLSLLLSTPPSL